MIVLIYGIRYKNKLLRPNLTLHFHTPQSLLDFQTARHSHNTTQRPRNTIPPLLPPPPYSDFLLALGVIIHSAPTTINTMSPQNEIRIYLTTALVRLQIQRYQEQQQASREVCCYDS